MTIAVIIPAFNAARLIEETLVSIASGSRAPDELIVVDDGSTDRTIDVANSFGARVIAMPKNAGPAACRNHAALLVHADVLVFLDADTCAHADTLQLMEQHLAADQQLSAVIGAYDDTPRHTSLCSQYRNLSHCYVHRSAKREARTFWSGCGAVRRQAFLRVDGFDERYRRPSVEDIELGYRMTDRGLRILLDPAVQVTHTKRWTIANSITTDVRDRGVPWMLLLLQRGGMPNDLNLTLRSRLATLFVGLAALCVIACLYSLDWIVPATVLAVLAVALDAGMLQFLYRERGAKILPLAIFMRLVVGACNIAATLAALALWARRSLKNRFAQEAPRRSQIADKRGFLQND